MADEMIRLDVDRMEELAVDALCGLGLPRADAERASSVLVLADLFGIHTHGISRIPSYGERLKVGGIKAQARIQIERVSPALLRIDGDNGIGPLVGCHALSAALEAAEQTGLALALARGSNHFGPIAPYCYMAAQKGYATFIASNATQTIAPWGGRDARLGNNPIGFGIPHPGGNPILLDMALSVAARAKIRSAAKAGKPIPEGWATDAAGTPTTDPAKALEGFLLAIGGHKGYGLSLIVDLLAGLLSGAAYLTHVSSWVDAPAAPQNLGHFFLAIDTRKLMAEQELVRKMADFAEIIHATPRADPERSVLLPGEMELSRMARHRDEGIDIPASLYDELSALASTI